MDYSTQMHADWTLVIDGIDFGEGPRWHDGRLWFSDFYQQTISSVEIHPDGSGTRHVELEHDGRPSGLGWLPDGRLLFVSMLDRKIMRREADGTVVVHADLSEVANGHVNDMVVSSEGVAYVGNFGFDFEGGENVEATTMAIVRPDGSVTADDHPLLFPNGAVLTHSERTLIVGETFGGQYTAFTIDHDGSLTEPRIWAAVDGTAPDGCTLDDEEGIWFADAVGQQIVRVVGSGDIDDLSTTHIGTPNNTYACMLGGDDEQTLFILTADDASPDKVAGTASGAIYSTRVEVRHAGRP
ncbi:SMP-30/gluconolactonase/LRE family protein [Ilumatobacter nonamiensis]|uniref:SMP-30/gluconolactonase/LRE family protein n=1 Tax=Ilumatobacter nonamiensis TaxID=467093 RepID=UPI00034763E2|nr:SMP-30/gluconolactonase/LRE family protein [Ilumatobacter nonamiensis]